MIDYLGAELYKLIHRRTYTFVFLAVVFAGIALLFWLLKYAAGSAVNTFDSVVYVLIMLLPMGLYLTVAVCDMVFSDQYKINTLKNEVSYGITKLRLYLGKLSAAVLAAFAFCGIIVVFYLFIGRLLFQVETNEVVLLAELRDALIGAIPLWLGALGFFMALLFLTGSSTLAAVLFIVIMNAGSVLELMSIFLPKLRNGIAVVKSWLLPTLFNDMLNGRTDLWFVWLVGLLWFAVPTVLGLILFRKREIS